MLLPHFGGAPAVWNTCMVFFQTTLLGGYVYGHALTSRMRQSRQNIVHLLLFLLSLAMLPVVIPKALPWLLTLHPLARLLFVLAAAVGLPFFALSANGLILQRWLSQTEHPSARDPYFLFGASNFGSFLALLAYPFVLERFFSLKTQSYLWSGSYLAVGVAVLVIGFLCRGPDVHVSMAVAPRPAAVNQKRWLWTALSFVPSSLLLGVTTYIATDVASIPLIWMVPLALYLLTFFVAFLKPSLADFVFKWTTIRFSFDSFLTWIVLAAASIGCVFLIFAIKVFPEVILLLHLLVFSMVALFCHLRLAKERPFTDRLTEFYFFVALGGALGGMFNALVAPFIFKTVLEYPLAIALFCMLRPVSDSEAIRWNRGDLLWPLALAAIAILIPLLHGALSSPHPRLPLYIISILCLAFGGRPVRFGLAIAGLIFASSFYPDQAGRILTSERSFFGVHRVLEDKEHGIRWLNHGTTVHGAQYLTPWKHRVPLTYYHPTGPAGDVFFAFNHIIKQSSPVAVIGLGAGSLIAYAQSNQRWTFFEIDPAVARIAEDTRFFSFLADHRGAYEVVLGDGRLTLAQQPNHSFGLIVIDAFSSDAVPLHLLTKEAMDLYVSKLSANGFIAMHLSNRFLNLAPVVANLAADRNAAVFLRVDRRTNKEIMCAIFPSIWVVMAPKASALSSFLKNADWQLLSPSDIPLWSDDYSNILSVWRITSMISD